MGIRRIINLPAEKMNQITNRLILKMKGISVPRTLRTNGRIRFYIGKGAQIKIGDEVVITSSIDENHGGGKHDKTIICLLDNTKLTIGDRSGISNSTIYVTESITIGNDVNIGVDTCIWDGDGHSLKYNERIQRPETGMRSAPVVIKDGVFIGGNCMILKGVTIGERSVIAAGSVVTKDVPADQVWGGSPARFIKNLNN